MDGSWGGKTKHSKDYWRRQGWLVPTASLHPVPIQLKNKEQISAGKEWIRLFSATIPSVGFLA
jgi:hypothetical protein